MMRHSHTYLELFSERACAAREVTMAARVVGPLPVAVGAHGLLETRPQVAVAGTAAREIEARLRETEPDSEAGNEAASEGEADGDVLMGDLERLLQRGQREAYDVTQRDRLADGETRLLMLPGQVLPAEPDAIRGHGTHVRPHDGAVASSVGGFLTRVGKLVSVQSTRQRYRGEVGDVVVGRISIVQQKSWRVEINAAHDGILQLSAVNLPGGILRRRTTSDQLQMRELFAENDVIVAEVQQVHHDGALALHTRSLKYGRLAAGQLVSVRAALIRRTKNQFHQFPFSVMIIVGMNGLIWIGPRVDDTADPSGAGGFSEELSAPTQTAVLVSADVRLRISRVRAAILVLARAHLPIFPESIFAVYARSLENQVPVSELLSAQHEAQLTQGLME
jgi:exosome complex component RRP4